jgi:hypothetical protein
MGAMRRLVAVLGLLAACGTTGSQDSGSSGSNQPLPDHIKEQEKGLTIERGKGEIKRDKPIPKPSEEEKADFERIWQYFLKNDPRWPLERDRFKQRSEAASYVLTAELLRRYMDVNAARERAGREVVRVKDEIVALGAPAAPYLVRIVVLDTIPMGDGKRFLTDDLTRQDCMDMLERMGTRAVPALLDAFDREDLNAKSRRLLAVTLGGTKDKRAYDLLVRLLLKDERRARRATSCSTGARAVAEYEIGGRARVCAATGEPFDEGSMVVSAIYLEGDAFVRRDYAADRFPGPEEAFSVWKSQIPIKAEEEQFKLDFDLAGGFLEKLVAEADPQREGLVYVLTLLLSRKRRVKILKTAALPEGEQLLTVRIRGAEEDQEVQVRAPRLDAETVAALQQELAELFGFAEPEPEPEPDADADADADPEAQAPPEPPQPEAAS